ncbi:FHA domain-containing protein DDL-like [Papaver somniferum]|uniref:FHA domain-containing protein DDL-like n=1 Tax=Papaver somniferum TaxID=3469 RepID=UPI000E6F971B|nr:FHA domain-containing protein DDL-like [Papaver somniferum]
MDRGSDSDSPAKGRGSSRRRSPVQRERSPARRKSSPRTRSPVRTSSSHRTRSPIREKDKSSSRGRSPRHESTRTQSPRTKRLQRAQADMEVDREREGRRYSSSREGDKERHKERGGDREGDKGRRMERGGDKEGDKERNRERGGDRDDPRNIRERRPRETENGGNSRSKHKQSTSPIDRSNRNRNASRSPLKCLRSRAHDELPNSEGEDHRGDEGDISVAKMKAAEEALEKQKPSFELSGKLAEETNRVKGVTLLFTEPSDARIPDVRWRLYVFKGGEVLNDPLYIHRKTCYLFGRERRVADIPTDHPSCSKQHAVIQYRLVEKEQPDGMLKKKVSPYIMDLGSTNGTFINDDRIESQRYYELKEKDTIKFGNSSREYVVLHENSAH